MKGEVERWKQNIKRRKRDSREKRILYFLIFALSSPRQLPEESITQAHFKGRDRIIRKKSAILDCTIFWFLSVVGYLAAESLALWF